MVLRSSVVVGLDNSPSSRRVFKARSRESLSHFSAVPNCGRFFASHNRFYSAMAARAATPAPIDPADDWSDNAEDLPPPPWSVPARRRPRRDPPRRSREEIARERQARLVCGIPLNLRSHLAATRDRFLALARAYSYWAHKGDVRSRDSHMLQLKRVYTDLLLMLPTIFTYPEREYLPPVSTIMDLRGEMESWFELNRWT